MGYYCCGIYEQRPEVCKRYPESGSYIPSTCTYYFADGERKGECDPECNASCCLLPRQGGEPGGAPLPEIAGGESCRHLIYTDECHRSPRQVSSNWETDPPVADDREGNRQVTDAIELVLAAKRSGEGDSSGAAKVGPGSGSGKGG